MARATVDRRSSPPRRWITRFGAFVAHPAAFLVVAAYGLLWLIFDRESFDWHGFTALIIWFMTLFMQRVWHRDTQAIQAKLDELLRVEDAARNELTRIDEREPEEIVRHRAEEREKNDE